MDILITSGGTREYIDPVRFITNASSGKMGLSLVHAALKAGHNVTLISSLPAEGLSENVKYIRAETTAQMATAVKRHLPHNDCLIMAAAVSDYTVKNASSTKIKKSSRPLKLTLVPTEDILKWAGTNKETADGRARIIAGFALEDEELLKNAREKMTRKNLDLIIANSPEAIGAGKSTVYIITQNGSVTTLERKSKALIAERIIQVMQQCRNQKIFKDRGTTDLHGFHG